MSKDGTTRSDEENQCREESFKFRFGTSDGFTARPTLPERWGSGHRHNRNLSRVSEVSESQALARHPLKPTQEDVSTNEELSYQEPAHDSPPPRSSSQSPSMMFRPHYENPTWASKRRKNQRADSWSSFKVPPSRPDSRRSQRSPTGRHRKKGSPSSLSESRRPMIDSDDAGSPGPVSGASSPSRLDDQEQSVGTGSGASTPRRGVSQDRTSPNSRRRSSVDDSVIAVQDEGALENLKAELLDLKALRAAEMEEFRELQADYESLRSAHERLETQNDEVQQSLNNCMLENENLKVRLADTLESQQAVKADDTDHEHCRDGIQQVTKRLAETQQELDTARDKLADSEATVKRLSKDIENPPIDQNCKYDSKAASSTLLQHLTRLTAGAIKSNQSLVQSSQNKPSVRRSRSDKSEWVSDERTWHQQYLAERASHQALEDRFLAVQKTASRAVELEQSVQQLHEDLANAQADLKKVDKLREHHELAATAWQNEVHLIKQTSNQRNHALEDVVQEQKEEMLQYISAYRDKLSKDWGDVQHLHRKIADMERSRDETNTLFNKTKTEKNLLTSTVTKLQETLSRAEKHADDMQRAFLLGEKLPGPFWDVVDPPEPTFSSSSSEVERRPISSSNNSTSSSSFNVSNTSDLSATTPNASKHNTTTTAPRSPSDSKPTHPLPTLPSFLTPHHTSSSPNQQRIPRCHLPIPTATRRSQLAAYRASLSAARHDAEALDYVLEKAREHFFKRERLPYPPEVGWRWERNAGKTSWERWEGEKWVVDESTGEEDGRVVRGLWEKGVLEGRGGGRRRGKEGE